MNTNENRPWPVPIPVQGDNGRETACADTTDRALSPFTHPSFLRGRPHLRAGPVFSNVCPVDNVEICKVAAGTAVDVDLACVAASRAFPAWHNMAGEKRQSLLHKLADAIESRAADIALVESHDTGQALPFMNKAALRGAENFRFFADRAPASRDGLSLPAADHLNYTLRQPIGPVGVISPWNTPFMLSTWKIAPAPAAGCTLVHKPAAWSPMSAQLLVEILHEAGLPADVLNTVHGMGEVAGRALTQHPLVKAIAFVGDTATGRAIIAAGGTRHAQLTGGNFVMPTLFAHATADMAISQEEIFGPVLTTLKFTDEADALAKANGVAFGLAAYLWTSQLGRAMRLARDLDAGMVWVNSENNRHLPSPFGGMKASGIGRDGGDYSFDFYMETRSVCIALDTHTLPTLGKS